MNSVALPASATTSTPSTEADMVRQAARGDEEAFGELFRRHASPAWRLAQAVSADADAATVAFRAGFGRAVRAGRLPRRASGAFRSQVLSSVYRAAIDQAYDRGAAPAPTRRAGGGDPEAALASAAFRSLPERWRAALWLSEVENLDADRIAGVLGVSTVVAEQLVSRGRRGLAGRFSQAHHEAPEHVGEILRPLAIAMPADLAEVTAAGWSAAGRDHLSALAPAAAWLEERATRPMSVAVGALIGLGLIGLGVVPGGSPFRSQLQSISPSSVNGAVPVHTCYGLACPGQGLNGSGGTTASSGFLTGAFSGGGSGSGSGFGGSAGGGSGFLAGTGGPSGTAGPAGSAPGTPAPGSSAPGGTSPLPGVPTVPGAPSTVVNVPGVATITNSSGTLNTSLVGGAAGTSTGPSGVSANLGGTTITLPGGGTLPRTGTLPGGGTTAPAPTQSASTNSTSTTLGLLPAVGSTLSGLTSGL